LRPRRRLTTFAWRILMKKSRFIAFLAAFLLFAGSFNSFAAELSFTRIKNLYNEGEFEKIRISLEDFLKKSGKSSEPKERIFAYKYLGVIYAAEPQGYPLAETYFYQLLKLAPNAHLSDMYVSTAIEEVFSRTQVRFRKENQDNLEFDEFGNPRKHQGTGMDIVPAKRDTTRPIRPRKTDSLPPRQSSPQKQSSIRAWPWLLGGGMVLAVGGYFWYSNQETPKKAPTVTDGGKQ
jgi:hypothetical protein